MGNDTPFRQPGDGTQAESFSGEPPTSLTTYQDYHRASVANRSDYWRGQALALDWSTPFTTVVSEDFTAARIAWFTEGTLNATANALRASDSAVSRMALEFYRGGTPSVAFSREELSHKVMALAGALKASGCASGDRVALYLPDCPESVLIMLACAWIGVTYVPIPIRFTAEIAGEILADCAPALLVVAPSVDPEGYGLRAKSLLERSSSVAAVSVGDDPSGQAISFDTFCGKGIPIPAPLPVSAEHPLFILYANSAAGIPRGSVFATGGFLVQARTSFRNLFRLPDGHMPERVYCTVDFASAAGQSCGLWGPLSAGAGIAFSTEGHCATAECLGGLIRNNAQTALLTSPHLLADLRASVGDGGFPGNERFALVACCGDTLNPRLVKFAAGALTSASDRVINLWIQSESGTPLIATVPAPELNRSGALGLPVPGMEPLALNTLGDPCRTNESGQLVFASSWPAMIRTIWNQPDRFLELYFRRFPGCYSTNDGVRLDGEGFYWFMGRLDDVIKVRGQSLATAEVEAVLLTHPEIAEAAVISPGGDEMDTLYAFLVLSEGRVGDDAAHHAIETDLAQHIARRIGEFAVPSKIVFTSELPRTRTGKIVRRLLRRVAAGDVAPDEDISYVANPHVVEELIRKKEG